MKIRNNWLELKINLYEIKMQVSSANYYPKGSYAGKLSEQDWTKTKDLFLELYNHKQLKVLPEAEIISTLHTENGKTKYVVWLEFIDTATNNIYKLDVPIWKTNYDGNRINERHIDNNCPLVETVRNAILNNEMTAEDLETLIDIVNSRPDKLVKTPEGKVQYKLNGSLAEDIAVITANEVGLNLSDDLDPYNKYFYKGSPGNLSDFDITLDNGKKVRVDIKLIKSDDTSKVEKDAHDADYLICYNFNANRLVVKKVKDSCQIDLLADELFKKFMQKYPVNAKNILSKTPLIQINSFNLETGKVDWEWLI